VVSANAALRLVSVTVTAHQVGAGGGDGGGGPGGRGGGGGLSAFGSATLRNTIVAGNGGGNCLGATTDGGHNLSFPDTTCPGVNGDPKLGAPQDNGGPTATAALAAGSAAIDQVPASGAGCPATDQRGTPRPQGTACDIGAFELGQAPSNTLPPAVSGSPAVGRTLICTSGRWKNAPLTYTYQWLRDGTVIAGAAQVAHHVIAADATHSLLCRVTATNHTASASADSAAVRVRRGGRPVASRLRVSPAAFTAATSGPSATTGTKSHRHPKSGAKISYALNIAATVRFTVQQRVPGRTQGHGQSASCVAQTRSNRKAERCMRTVTLRGAFTETGKSGSNTLHFSGRLGGRALTPGKYRLVATPTADGQTGAAANVGFRILR
jgi:hypothetical protein